MGGIGKMLGALALVLCISYGTYWVFKKCSYVLFYESMVEETVRNMVSPEYLNPKYINR